MIRHKLDRIFVGQEGQVESLWFRIGPMFKLMSEPENPNDAFDGDLLLEAAQPKLKKPSFYGVVLLNDDYTPMEFVVEVLERFFGKDRTAATQIMLIIHTKGKAVCGLYPKDIAETKAHAVNRYSRESEHPLLCEIEPANNSDE